jgi:hypothetical protein
MIIWTEIRMFFFIFITFVCKCSSTFEKIAKIFDAFGFDLKTNGQTTSKSLF